MEVWEICTGLHILLHMDHHHIMLEMDSKLAFIYDDLFNFKN